MNTHLQQAANLLIEHWDGGIYIEDAMAGLRKALDAEIAQPVEPDAWMRHDSFKAMTDDEKAAWIESGNAEVVEEYTKPLYLHPPQPQTTTTTVPELLEELENCRDLLEIAFPDAPVDSCIGVGIIKASAAIAAAQGEKP